MLRTGLGVLDTLLGSGGVQGGLFKGIIRGGNKAVYPSRAGTIPATRTITTRAAFPSAAVQLWATARLGSSRTAARAGRLRTPLQGPTGPRRPFQTSRARRKDGKEKEHSSKSEEAGKPLSLSGRLKKLSREYGWTAVGVYLTLSVLDFPFCFLLVRIVGTEKIAAIEEIVVRNVQKVIPESVKTFYNNYKQTLKENTAQQSGATAAGGEGEAVVTEDVEIAGWGVEEARARKEKEGASLATQLALAYAIHKSFIFVRVPLTAAILPKVVKVLRSWGWKIGRKTAKSAK
ncbi:N-terminal acetyltransferase 2 [Rhypophila decipiens]|uniref:N-terminal acetyltransferase 2 n=1 Tax=Rhypophila decipiens TaxID=261697 RepID=A0AAN6YH03_9PEZI|nr:N-terminal acetyltransferase 2 [Rhypophila decipiens]